MDRLDVVHDEILIMTCGTRGFTLIEVLIGVSLLGLVALSTAPMFVYAIQRNAAGADFGTVGAAAVERMELLRAERLSNLPQGGSLTADVAPYFDASNPDYIVRWEILDNATAEGGKRVSVRVLALRQVSGLPKDVTLTTLRGG